MDTYREREDKFDVPANWPLPGLDPVVPDGGHVEVQLLRLESTYYDTEHADLRRYGVTLRRRSGDEGLGWQLKVPEGAARRELRSASRRKTVPQELASVVAGVVAGRPLLPVARLVTNRSAHRVLDSAGGLVAEVADDRVDAASLGEESRLSSWREIEVELGPAGGEEVLRRCADLLRTAGAEPPRGRTKLDRALGGQVADSRPVRSKRKRSVNLLQSYIAEQCEVVVSNDLAIRSGIDRVHKTRVALRRLRSTIRIFAAVIDEDATVRLEPELVWYAGLLGDLRDLDIVEHRLLEDLAALPPEQVLGPVQTLIQEVIGIRRATARRLLRQAMDSQRYLDLLVALRTWRFDAPLLTSQGGTMATLRVAVDRARRKATKRLTKAGEDPGRLHRARKATKRARYAAELLKPVDKKAARRAAEAEDRQEVLGDHQDAVMTAALLVELGAAAGARAEQNGFTFGVLLANELHRAAQIRRQVHQAY